MAANLINTPLRQTAPRATVLKISNTHPLRSFLVTDQTMCPDNILHHRSMVKADSIPRLCGRDKVDSILHHRSMVKVDSILRRRSMVRLRSIHHRLIHLPVRDSIRRRQGTHSNLGHHLGCHLQVSKVDTGPGHRRDKATDKGKDKVKSAMEDIVPLPRQLGKGGPELRG